MANTKDQIIMSLYNGESIRDASSKIRGYFFQDLIAIDELIEPQTEYVCLEYVEDVMSVIGNTVHIIQAKYYPKSSVKMPEIMRELYYQYLRMQLFGYSDTVIPILAVHSTKIPCKPSLAEMLGEKYINVNRTTKPNSPTDIDSWMKKNVYHLTKEEAEDACFKRFAWNESIESFLKALKIISKTDTLKEYRLKIADRLVAIPFPGCLITDNDMRKSVMLGLAVQYIQDAYTDIPAGADVFCWRKRERNALLEYIKDRVCTETDESIGAYLRMVVMDCWDAVEKHNPHLTQEQIDILQCIRDYTADWLYRLGNKPQGQLQLLNSVSMRDKDTFVDFLSKSFHDRLQMIHEHRNAIRTFLRYMWKIILNINCDLLGKALTNIEQDRLRPETYLDRKESCYLKIKFHGEAIDSAVILSSPDNSQKNEDITCTFERLAAFRPQKWYMCDGPRGKYSYSQNVADITNSKTISSIQPDQFRIECMNCIKVDMDCWHNMEICENTIFLENCVQEVE